MSLRWRIAAGLGLIAALVSGFGAAAAYVSTSQRLTDGVDETLMSRAQELSRFAAGRGGGGQGPRALGAPAGGDPAGGDPVFARPEACPPGGVLAPAAAAQVIARDGTVTVCIEDGPVLPVDRADRALARSGGRDRFRSATITGDRYRILIMARTEGGAFQVARDLVEVDDVLESLRLRLAAIGAVGVAGAVLLGWLVARRTVRPIESLGRTAETIARTQDLTTPIPTAGAAEIGSLARSFTAMVTALAASRQEQHQLVRDASHELRTPLTSLRTNAELLARADELQPHEFAAVVDGVQLEVGELAALVSELVELATDQSSAAEDLERLELGDLASEVADRARRRSGRDVRVVRAGASLVDARPQMIARAISNLVDNALKYSPSGSPVLIDLAGTRLEVRDEGAGIPPADLPHVFDRFYRSVEARTAPGSGLGLAIVKQAIERHGGTVWASNRPGGGAAVGFQLAAVEASGPRASE